MNTKCFRLFPYALLFCLSILFYKETEAQYRLYNDKYYESNLLIEIGGSFGAMNCLTDLGGNAGVGKKFFKDINLENSQPCKGIYVGLLYKDVIGVRIEATLGDVNAHDSILKPVAASTFGRYDRNLSFKSSIAEIALIGEFHPLALFDFGNKNFPRLSPYLLAGIGSFSFNPQANLKGNWIDLHPLRLEGQGFKEYPDRKEYSLNAICYPVGFGIKYEISAFFAARLEFIYRFTNTDYLDDASQGEYIKPELFSQYLSPRNTLLATQLYARHKELNPNFVLYPGQIRGQINNNDAYLSVNLKLGITLGREKIK